MNQAVSSSRRKTKILSGLSIILGVIVLFLILDRGKLTESAQSALNIARVETQQLHIWRNKHGLSQARAQAAESNLRTIKETYSDTLKDLRKQIHGLKRNYSNAHSVVTVSSKTEGEVNTALRDTVVTLGDTITTRRSFSYQDDWSAISGIFSEDSLSLKYSIKDSLAIVSYWKRPGFWKSKILYVEAVTYNPHTTFTGLRQIAVKRHKDRFVIGPFAGIDFRGRPTVGIGLTYKFFGF